MNYVALFSSGRTSALMVKFFMEWKKFNAVVSVYGGKKGRAKYHYHTNNEGDKLIVLMMNTGRECKESLTFANKCDFEFGLKITYLEAVVNNGYRKGTTHKILPFHALNRNGDVFENILKKYPLPNNKASNCTRELKQRPKESFLREIGWWNNCTTLVGIRKDEEHRKSIHAKAERLIYPLCDIFPINQMQVREFWNNQPFDLELKDYQGNCDLCFKKSLKKRLTIIKENPLKAEWWLRMEQKYASEEVPRFDLRTNKSVSELIELSKQPFTKAEDLFELSQQQKDLFEIETDCFCKAT